MIGQIFICYRHDDSSGWAGRLHDRLEAHFPQIRIFMDVDLPPGANWMETIKNRIRSCDVFIVVIGKGWTDNPRLAEPNDVLRTEIYAALNLGIQVIPVLVDGAEMPRENQLPKELQPLAGHQAIEVRHQSFRDDSKRLICQIENIYSKELESDENRLDAEPYERKETERQNTRRFDGPSPTLPREKHAWRAVVVKKGRAERQIQVTLSNATHRIEFAVTKDIFHPQVIRIDGEVVVQAGSALTWIEDLVFRITDGDQVYDAMIKAKRPFHYRKFSMCKLLIDGRLLYAD